jgi:plastocyanin
MTRYLVVALSVLLLGLVATGCGGGSKNGGGASRKQATAARTTTTPTSSSGGSGKTVEVAMKNIQFQPRNVTIKRGTTVKWVNDDSVAHDVTKSGGPGPKFKSGTGNLAGGASYTVTLKTPGRIDYICSVHQPNMKGTITVK